ncbi:MAG: glycosyltransferase family A protein [Candidatus Paceibacterota bacterium]|jgi:glycosyltransferase involved in cell wall biosynthesis
MKISFIIPSHNEEKYIGQCLESIFKEVKGSGHDYEIIVVNNASADNTRIEAEKFSGVKVLDELRKGTNFARQKGLDNAQGDYLAYLDADTKLPSGWIDYAEKAFQKDPGMVSLSGPYKYYDIPKLKGKILDALWQTTAPVSYKIIGYMVLGGNFIVKKEALLAAGGFDTNIKFYGDDMDTAKRLSKVGKAVFDMNFYNYSSCRRFLNQGVISLSLKYAINLIWVILFNKPFNKSGTI